MKKQFNSTTPGGSQIWYLATEDRSDDVLSGSTWATVTSLHLHRTEGPAVIGADGWQEWYMNGTRYRNNKSFQQAANLTDEEIVMMIIKYGDVIS